MHPWVQWPLFRKVAFRTSIGNNIALSALTFLAVCPHHRNYPQNNINSTI